MTESESTYLDRILAAKRAELAGRRHALGQAGVLTDRHLEHALQSAPAVRDFIGALREGPAPRIIAEFKRASPSKGAIRPGAPVDAIVQSYVRGGAAAVSVLTDRHFEGTIEDLEAARAVCEVPVLRKDFVLDRLQLVEARACGADAALLIVAALQPPALRQLIEFAEEIGLQVLCEAHDEYELDRAMAAGARLIGVNARDLRTFELDLGRCAALRKLVPRSFTYVAESGIESPDDIRRLRDADVDAVLIGTSLMRADDPGRALRSLLDDSL